MTIIKPNSIAGITSITAQGDVINLYKSDGTLAGLQLNGVNFNTTSGVSTFNNVTVGGTITYQDVAHVDSVGIITAQQGLQVLANGLDVTGVSTFNDSILLGTTNAGYPEFADNFTLEDSANCGITLRSGNTNQGNIYFSDDTGTAAGTYAGIVGYRHDTNKMYFYTSSTERLVIDKDGRIGIGVSPGTAGYSSYDNLVISDSSHSGITIKSGSTSFGGVNFADTNNVIGGYVVYHQGPNIMYFGIDGTGTANLSASGFNVTGIVTATSFSGDGSQLSGISVGLTTESASPNNTITHLDLTNAQDHKLIVSGITTISVTGGTEADSHTIRIQNSGISTVGFSTYFLFPSGAAPSLPTADGAISLISFTVHRVGAAGTQLLAGASVNFS